MTFTQESRQQNLERIRDIPSGDLAVVEHKSGGKEKGKGVDKLRGNREELRVSVGLLNAKKKKPGICWCNLL